MAKGRRPQTHNQALFYRELGERLRDVRLRVGLTQEALALAVGISRPSLVNIEQGGQECRLHLAILLAAELQIPLLDLLPNKMKPKPVHRLVTG